ncbi:hypothetical protein IJG73_00180 [Candidatus Saccharibacteria bacterium]|nr:hypothetical protein [Candidatus Saccharibacteria bacterium]
MMKKNVSKSKTKRGAASLYVVIFITLLFGVITLSFVRLVISEATKTTNTDLSQSAYDSALAGIEDAKVALLKYHDCLSRGYSPNRSGNECEKAIYNMQSNIDNGSCDPVAATLARKQESDGSVVIQETKDSTQKGNSSNMLQAYTCVKINEELDDYRTTLDTNTRLRIIPIRSSQIDNLGSIKVRWFSDQNKGNQGFNYFGISRNDAPVPPVISVQLLQADPTFKLSHLSVSSAVGTDRATAYFSPSRTSDLTNNSISAKDFSASNNKAVNNKERRGAQDVDVPGNKRLYRVICADSNQAVEWFCEANISVPNVYGGGTNRNDGATFIIVTLPYGAPTTDLSVQLYDRNGNVINFSGVQARVDSTGRANDLYRRIETRVELVDVNYPYPEFTIQMNDNQNSVIEKKFSVTRNCWTSNNGGFFRCPNNIDI